MSEGLKHPKESSFRASLKNATSQVPEAEHVEFTPEQERKLWRKIDLRLMPIISLMYLFAFMDRGNAKLEGLVTQLDLTGNRFNVALTTFFISYILFECPANVAIHRVRPSRWLPFLMVSGLLASALAYSTQTYYPQLAAVRFCLGLAEGGFYPGLAYYLTMWYPKYKLQYRLALFLGMTTAAGAFSGLLAYGIGFMNNVGGLQGWSWIFIIEGLITVVICCIAAIIFVDYPGTAKFLSAEERLFVEQERREYQFRDVEDDEEGTILQRVWMTLADWQVWAMSIVLMSVVTPGKCFHSSLADRFGYSTAISQLLTVPIYVAAAIVMLTAAHFSDKRKLRSPFILVLQSIALIGYVIELSDASAGVKYFGTFLCVVGVFAPLPCAVCWLANNLEGKYKRAIGLAFQNSIAGIGGIIASNIYRAKDDPRFILGHVVSIGFLVVGFLTALSTALIYRRINLNRHALVQGGKGGGDIRQGHPLRTL
ncbi:MFS general substrate transporter [Scleroderma citrinum]